MQEWVERLSPTPHEIYGFTTCLKVPELFLKKAHPANVAFTVSVPVLSDEVVTDATLLTVGAVPICFEPTENVITCPSGTGPRDDVMVAVNVTG